MKTLFKPLLLLAFAAVAFSSCMKDNDDTDYEAEYLKQEKAMDSLLSAEKIKIQDYLASTEGDWKEDTVTISLRRLGKTVKRGIWYEVLAEPTSEDDLYEYKAQNVGYDQYQIVPPSNVKLKYRVYSLDSTTPLKEDAAGSEYSFTNTNTNLTAVWFIGFSPYTAKFEGENVNLGLLAGLTEKGLQKNSKIRIISPSYWLTPVYSGQQTPDYLPSNAPAIYEFEVLDIK